MSLADIALGSHMLKLVFNKHGIRCQDMLYVLKEFPLTYEWANETINGTFFGWM